MSETRMPTQKRSIEKRNRIIEKGFELMCENGYYNTTIPDIAKYAEVSVGIIYQYFNDKKDIFIEGVSNYANNIMYPMIKRIENGSIKIENLKSVLEIMIDNYINKHKISKKAHEELMAMSYLDEDVAKIFNNSEMEMTQKIVSLLENNNIYITNSYEKVHIVIGIIDNLCHEIIYHKHESLDYNIMKDEVIDITTNILK
jgi:AcrR family transcriptional regulator